MNRSSDRKKSNRNMYMIALLIVTVGLALYFLIKPDSYTETTMQTEVLDIPFAGEGVLMFISQAASDTLAVIEIEVADNNQKRARGLMYRKSIPENSGMLFSH